MTRPIEPKRFGVRVTNAALTAVSILNLFAHRTHTHTHTFSHRPLYDNILLQTHEHHSHTKCVQFQPNGKRMENEWNAIIEARLNCHCRC